MRHSRTFTALLVSGSLLAGFLVAGAAQAAEYTLGGLQISHPWTPATPEGAKAATGYVTVTNTGRQPDSLISGSFVDASRLEIKSASGGGTIVIAPGETVTLKPGGDHLMFTGLIGGLTKGGTAQAILRFEKAGPIVIEFDIEAAGKGAAKRPGRQSSAR